jgi:hypothetical protein
MELTPAQQVLLSRADGNGYVTATGDAVKTADRLVTMGLLRHRWGIVYELTSRALSLDVVPPRSRRPRAHR